MKKLIYVLSAFILTAAYSCKKNTEGNKSVIVNEQSATTIDSTNGSSEIPMTADKTSAITTSDMKEVTERYVAEDGSSALVTFRNSDQGNSISIRSNNKTIALPQKDSDGNATVYENQDIVVKSENDMVTITQGNNVISLKKARINK